MSVKIAACLDIAKTTARVYNWDSVMCEEDFQRMIRVIPMNGSNAEVIDAMEKYLMPFKLKYELSIEDFSI